MSGAALLIAIVAALGVVYQRGGFVSRAGASAASPIRALVVLPFENLTGDAGQDYLVDSVTDAVTTHLAQVQGLDVISRTSARQYKKPFKPLLLERSSRSMRS